MLLVPSDELSLVYDEIICFLPLAISEEKNIVLKNEYINII
jgi:hypothetical protein